MNSEKHAWELTKSADRNDALVSFRAQEDGAGKV